MTHFLMLGVGGLFWLWGVSGTHVDGLRGWALGVAPVIVGIACHEIGKIRGAATTARPRASAPDESEDSA